MDTNGQVQDAPAAEKPAGMQFPPPHSIPAHLDSGPANGPLPHTENEVDEVTEMFKGLSKKKKSKKSKDTEGGEGDETPAADGEFDPSALKKKKKTKKPANDSNDFEAKLAEAGVSTEDVEEKGEERLPEGDLEAGTGIWQHDDTQAIPYALLVSRFFSLIQSHHPDLLSSGTKSYKIPPPQCLREGNRRTIFANIADICKRIKRSDEHVTQFLFAELGTSGSVDGSRRLVIKGRFQQKGIESVLRRYIGAYLPAPFSPSYLTYSSRIRHLQDLPQPRHRAQQGREPSVLRHLQLLRISSFGRRHQDWFPWTGRPQKAHWLNAYRTGLAFYGGGSFLYLFFLVCHLLGLWRTKIRPRHYIFYQD